MNSQKLKILVPIDGSTQALHAAVYAARMFAPTRTEIVLFHVDNQSTDLGRSLPDNPLYHEKIKAIDTWVADQQHGIRQFMELAVDSMEKAGFYRPSVQIKIKKKNEWLLDEIINESREGYDAVVVGKTGKSRLKDRVIGSVATKLVGKMNLLPLIIVDGNPRTDKMMLSIDRQEEAFKSISCIATLLDIQKFKIAISHVAMCGTQQGDQPSEPSISDEKHMCPLRDVECICPSIENMRKCFEDAGILSEHLTDIVVKDDNPVAATLELLRINQFGSIVVGRRAIVPFIEEVISGRYSRKILKKMENMALWVIN
ncbi:MAG: universal stress protein [Desulfobacteraceae bacterium]|nr:MAG: universal stress protein [Desulfobacteraceae bacterium]